MSIVALSTGEPTCTLEDLKAISQANNFAIAPGSSNETAFLLCANAFDATCQTVQHLPDYDDPRLAPSPVEGGKRSFHRPDGQDNPLNAWAHKTHLVSANAEAKNGRLAGKTIALKENVSVAGLPLGLGSSPQHFKDGIHPISAIDATVVKRILEAGGIVKGTATCENFSAFALSITSDTGVVHNAWLPGYATGGSSSGCGALVSIGDVEEARRSGDDQRNYLLGEGVDLAIGGDQGGSIRLPASYSGIYGLKPTHGLVPYTGIATLNPMVDHTGPMARSMEDIALLLEVMAGYDGLDPRMTPESPMPFQVPHYLDDLQSWVSARQVDGSWTPSAAARDLRVGILKEGFDLPGMDSAVAKAVRGAAERFRELGADVHEVSIKMHSVGASIWTVATRPMMPHFIANRPGDLITHTLPGLDPLPFDQNFFDILANRNPAVVNVLMNAAHIERKYGSALVRKAHMHVLELRAAYDSALVDLDVLITPTTPTVAPPHPKGSIMTDDNPRGQSERLMDIFEPAIGNTLNTCSFNVTGHPAMSMPVGWGKVKDGDSKLPIGMQLVAKRFDEASILKAAKAWEVGGSRKDSP